MLSSCHTQVGKASRQGDYSPLSPSILACAGNPTPNECEMVIHILPALGDMTHEKIIQRERKRGREIMLWKFNGDM